MVDKKTVKQTEIVILHESVAQSWARDASIFALFLSLIGVGIVLDSSALQWAGAVVAFITISSLSAGKAKRMTREEAIKHLTNGRQDAA